MLDGCINFRTFNLRYEYFNNITLYPQLSVDLNNKYSKISTYITLPQSRKFPEILLEYFFDKITNPKINKSMGR